MTLWDKMKDNLDRMEAENLLRRPVELESPVGPRVLVDGREVVCLCSNDYLALGNDPAVCEAAKAAIDRWGVGSGASRLVSGTMGPHSQLERTIAAFKGTESAILTPTGWMANRVAIAAMVGAGDLILCDKLNHASILDAASACGARLRTYHHNDTDRLRKMLEKHRSQHRRCLIVTDSLFSMDGDVAPLPEIVELKRQFDAQLMIDEAHATGVMGSGGRGAAEMFGVEDDIDVTVGTLSKALGCLGGFVAGREVLVDILRNTGRAYIYTTALPPAICAAACKAIEIVQTQPQRRQRLLAMAEKLRNALNSVGLDTLDSTSQILPVVIGDAGDAWRISQQLLAEGFLIPAIRPPTVPPGTSRLRISLSSGHDEKTVMSLVELLAGMR